MIGTTLSHFRIIAKLGEGGMGVVYRAEDEKLRRPVALKVLPPDLVGNEERRLRFLREARAAAAVTHPNIATIYEVGEAPDESGRGPGVVFIAMELVEGKTLRDLIGGRAMPMRDALRVAGEIAEGLARAHQAGVVHRDLKPDNVIVGVDGHAKILDFGLAKHMQERAAARASELSRMETMSEEMTTEGRVLGTTAYMSPEQARGEPADARSDLFSFGVTLYEMVTGALPFRGKTSADVLSAIIRDAPVPPSQANPVVPVELERIIDECLEKDPRERYQHADQLVVDLGRLKRTTDSGAREVSRGATARPRRGRLALAWAAALGLGTLAALLFGWNVGGVRERLWGGGAPGRIDSLAVLPLANLSGDPAQEYFADGMTDALIANLARIKALRVISRTSVMQYKNARKRLPEIARELNVAAVVEGSVLRSGERVRITTELIDAAADRHLWAQTYERDLKDVLALQSEVARAIVEEIKTALTPQEKASLANVKTVDPEAYQAYLAGRYYWNERTVEGFRKAIEQFERAIARDPNYAPAYAGLADSYMLLGDYGGLAPEVAYSKGKAAALKAIEADDTVAESHASLALEKWLAEWDWAGAETEFKRAIDLNPGYATAHHWYAFLLSDLRRHTEALVEIRKAQDLDPLSIHNHANVGWCLYFARRYDEAIVHLRGTLELDPHWGSALRYLGQIYVQQGKYEEAIAKFKEAESSAGVKNDSAALLAHAYAVSGRRDEAKRILDELTHSPKYPHVKRLYVAWVHLGLGDRDKAIEELEAALSNRETDLPDINVEPYWDPLRSDPRFQDVVRRVGLSPD